MRKFILATALLLTVFIPRVCAQSPPEKKEGEAKMGEVKANVYIYRYKQYAGGGLEPSVYCDGEELARMDNGRYFTVKLSPGKYVFRSNDKQAGIELELKSGEEYYIRVEIVAGFMKGHGRLVLTQKEQGSYEIKKLKPLDADKVKDRRVTTAEKADK